MVNFRRWLQYKQADPLSRLVGHPISSTVWLFLALTYCIHIVSVFGDHKVNSSTRRSPQPTGACRNAVAAP